MLDPQGVRRCSEREKVNGRKLSEREKVRKQPTESEPMKAGESVRGSKTLPLRQGQETDRNSDGYTHRQSDSESHGL